MKTNEHCDILVLLGKGLKYIQNICKIYTFTFDLFKGFFKVMQGSDLNFKY